MNPLGDTVFDIGAIGHDGQRACAIQRFKRHDRGHQLHLIVGRCTIAAA